MERRTFLKTVTAAATTPVVAGVVLGPTEASSPVAERENPAETVHGDMRYRGLGRTGEQVSLVGVGGSHIGKQKEERDSIRIIRTAIDRGVTFMDNSWDYNGGESERRMGKALRDGYRQKVFLMTKVDGRTHKEAARQIDESLKRLQTDHLDLLQHHEVIRMEDPDRIFAPGGAMEAFLAAKRAGKIRFVGFTGHKDPLVHLRMLEVAAKHDFHFDTAQMPLNVMDAHFRSFAHQVVPVLVREGVGILGMKSMGSGLILQSKVVTPTDCLHYAMSLPTSTVITGIDSLKILDQALEAVGTFRPLRPEQMAALLAKTAQAAADGSYERFKTGTRFDSTAKHPAWLG
jgi:aryl-alcohol dehydrogenase-like predicted oxidoreductase